MAFSRLTLSQSIAETIANEIVEGRRSAGERLLDKELADRFGTSSVPIREALFILETQGIVEKIPRKGVFVKKYSRKEVFELYDFCYRITEMALRDGIKNKNIQNLSILEDLIKKMKESVEEKELKRTFNYIERFHYELFLLSENSILIDVYEKVNKKWTTFRYLTLAHSKSLKNSVKEYHAILSGLESKDWELIKKNLTIKENRALNILEEYFKKQP